MEDNQIDSSGPKVSPRPVKNIEDNQIDSCGPKASPRSVNKV